MAPQDVIREFLVAIGWKNDEVGMKKAFDSITKAEKTLVSLAATAEAASLAVVAALGKMAEGFERAFYASSRTGVAVKELNAFKYAASQTGSTAEEAASAIEGLAEKIRSNRGYRNLIQGITKDSTGDIDKQLTELGEKFRSMSSERAYATGQMLGIPENLRLALMNPEFGKYQQEYRDRASAMGVDLEKAAKDGQSLTRSLRDVRSTLDVIIDAAATPLFQKLDGPLRTLNDFLKDHGQEIARVVGDIAAALLKITTYILEKLPEADKFVRDNLGGWQNVFMGLATVISAAFIGRLAGMVGSLGLLSRLILPPWALALLGVGAAGAAGAAWLHDHSPGNPIGDANEPSYHDAQHADPDGPVWGPTKRWWKRNAPGYLGGNADGFKGRQGFARRVFGKGGEPVSNAANYHNLTDLTDQAAKEAGIDPRIMHGIRAGESGHGSGYDVGDENTSFGPWQLHYGGGLGDQFTKETGLDARDPQTIPAQTRWVASYIAKHGRSVLSQWHGYHGDRDANPRWNDSGYKPDRPLVRPPPMVRVPPMRVPGHDGSPVPLPPNMPMPSAPPLFPANPTSSNVIINDHSRTEVNGVSDPAKAADHVGRADDRRQSTLLRNLQSAVG